MQAKTLFPLIVAGLTFVKCDCSGTAASFLISADDEYSIGNSFHQGLAQGTAKTDSTEEVKAVTFLGTKSQVNTNLSPAAAHFDSSAGAIKVARYVDSIGKSIAKQISDEDWATLLPSNNPSVTKENFFEFRVIKDDETVNAFAVAGGKTYFYTAILKQLKSEAELIGVMSHEMGHVIKHHTRSRLLKANFASIALGALVGQSILSNIGLAWWLNNNGQGDELEADSMGVTLANKVNANPSGIRTFFSTELVFDANGKCTGETTALGKVFQSMSTHPANCERVTHAQNLENSLSNKTDAENRSTKATEYQTTVKLLPRLANSSFEQNFLVPLQSLD